MAAKLHNVAEARIAATNASDTAALKILAQHWFVYVRVAVALNPASAPEVLTMLIPAELVSDDDYQIVGALLQNPNVTEELCAQVAAGVRPAANQISPRDSFARECLKLLFSHPSLRIEVAVELLTVLPDHTRGMICTTTRRKDILELLAKDRSGRIRSCAEKKLSLPPQTEDREHTQHHQ